MTIGDGLLYSTLLVLIFGAVWLISKHRAWKIVGKVFLFIVLGCVLIGFSIWGWFSHTQRPVRIEALAGIKIGMSLGDVQVKKGAPTRKSNDDNQINMLVYDTTYSHDSLIVLLRPNAGGETVYRVCQLGSFYEFGLSEYSDEDAIRGRLGEPSSSKIRDDNLTKRLTYDGLNVLFDIKQNKVEAFCVGLEQRSSAAAG